LNIQKLQRIYQKTYSSSNRNNKIATAHQRHKATYINIPGAFHGDFAVAAPSHSGIPTSFPSTFALREENRRPSFRPIPPGLRIGLSPGGPSFNATA
jgi:hypothetical protein